jgi:hypothetical protein
MTHHRTENGSLVARPAIRIAVSEMRLEPTDSPKWTVADRIRRRQIASSNVRSVPHQSASYRKGRQRTRPNPNGLYRYA